jgi:hypothetical protein
MAMGSATLGTALATLACLGFLAGCGSASGFCATHDCIPSFEHGHGSIIQCGER